jgi:hypothetical protein
MILALAATARPSWWANPPLLTCAALLIPTAIWRVTRRLRYRAPAPAVPDQAGQAGTEAPAPGAALELEGPWRYRAQVLQPPPAPAPQAPAVRAVPARKAIGR